MRRAAPTVATFILIGLALIAAFLVDASVQPRAQFISAPFAIPILIAVYALSTRGAALTSVLVVVAAILATCIDGVPAVPAIFHIVGLLIIGSLAIFIGEQRRVIALRARDAEEARRQVAIVLNRISDAFLAVDNQWRITFFNPSAGQHIQDAAAGLLGRNLWDAFPDLLGSRFEREYRRAVAEQVPIHFEELFAPRDSWYEVHAYPSPDGLSMYVRDVTERRRLEDALRRTENSLARAQQIAGLGSWDSDLRTSTVWWSDETYRLMGVEPGSIALSYDTFLGFVHPDDRESLEQAVHDALDEKKLFGIDHRIVRADGAVRVLRSTAEVVVDVTGKPVRMIGTALDITERKQAEEERERLLKRVEIERARFQAILESAASAIVYLDAETRQVLTNPQASRLFGHPLVPEGGPAQYGHQVIHPDGRVVPVDELPLQCALGGQSISQKELLVERPDGSQVPVLVSASAVRGPGGKVTGSVVVFQDVSHLKDLERLREEWASIIAHDLRQPITIISGYAGMLKAQQRKPQRTEEQKAIEHIITSARNLNRMVGDLLDVSQIEARQLTLDPRIVDLTALVQDVVDRTRDVTRGHPVRVGLEGATPPLPADPQRIEQVLGNLLSNAAKYSDQDAEILVEVARRDAEVEVAVTNHGPGIPSAELPRLFNRFYRTREARTGRTGGLGLGLYLTKGLVEAHGGRVWTESVPGLTTTFHFTLPLS